MEKYEFDIDKEIEDVNEHLNSLANLRPDIRFIRDEEKEKQCIVTYEHDYNKSNIEKVTVSYNPFLAQNYLEHLIAKRLREKGISYNFEASNVRLKNLEKNIDVLASNLKIPKK